VNKRSLFAVAVVAFVLTTSVSWAAEPYLARGNWYFSGKGTGTVAGSSETITATITGTAMVSSTGEAGDEWITNFSERSTWRLSSTNGYSNTYTLSENIPMSYHNTDNRYVFSDSGLTWDCTILDENTATMTCKGTTVIDGYRATVNIKYNASRNATPDIPDTPSPSSSGGDSGGGCSVGAFSPLLGLLLVPLVLLRR